MVELEQTLGGNMTKVLSFISIKFPEYRVNLFRFRVLLSEPTSHYHEQKGKKEGETSMPSNTGKTRPPGNTQLMDFFVSPSH